MLCRSVITFSFKEQTSFNFVTGVTVCSDFEVQEKKISVTDFHSPPSICHEGVGLDANILVFLNVEF